MKRYTIGLLAAFLGVVAVDAQATVILTPDMADWVTDDNSAIHADDLDDYAGSAFSGLSLIYKQNFGGDESGTFQGSYSTTFGEFTSGEPSGATITYAGGSFIDCPLCVLIVKDGNRRNDPEWSQYLFNLGKDTDPGLAGVQPLWDGMEDIIVSGFWPASVRGSIAHVAVFGKTTPGTPGAGGSGGAAVPEPASLLLLGSGLSASAFAMRRKRKKA